MQRIALLAALALAGCQVSCTSTASNRSAARSSTSFAAAPCEPLAGIREPLSHVTHGIIADRPDAWTDAKIDVATADMQPVVGKPIQLTLNAREVIRWQGGYALNGKTPEVDNLDVAFWIYFKPDNARSAALLNLGQDVTVSGKLNAIRFERNPSCLFGVRLYVEVDDAQLLEQHARG